MNKLSKRQSQQKIIAAQYRSEFSGPLPPPSLLEKYNEVLPGAAERLMTAFETQSSHRQNLENIVIESDVRHSLWGMIFAFVLCMFSIILSSVLIYNGKEIGGGILGGTSLASIASIFVYGSRQRSKERANKMTNVNK